MTMRGIDISNWQKGLNLASLNIDFAIVKATEGIGYVDPCCDVFVQQAIKKGICWGFYHFARGNDPVNEADFFIDNTKNYFGHGIVVLDYETNENSNMRTWAEKFMQRVHDRMGVWPLLYTAASWLPNFKGSWLPKYCGLWLAGYPYPATTWTTQDIPYAIDPWPFVAIWQFTSSLQLSGWNAGLDGNLAYMDKKAWALYAGAKSDTPSVQPTLNINDLIKEILQGKWGNGNARIKKLQNAGYDAEFIQEKINELYDIAYEVIKGKWGNGWNRKQALNGAGYNADLVQMVVNSILDER